LLLDKWLTIPRGRAVLRGIDLPIIDVNGEKLCSEICLTQVPGKMLDCVSFSDHAEFAFLHFNDVH
jgi:hypothetical protein